MKKIILSAVLISVFVSCKKESEPKGQENAVTQEKIDQYNNDEIEMMENTDTVSYVSADGKRNLKVVFVSESKDGKNFVDIQLKEGDAYERLGEIQEEKGNPAYSNGKNISWITKETGGKGTLTENDKKTEFVIN
ncbi:hypothetical protein [Flavobacterium columnare]|uniref:Uncharacterized protein n=1 Tax=Flavobacterium columnare TaxID=996 RepID=A0AAI8CG25_9FLAO|nr:hypothetical protein [Flavobacterium columnare]AMO19123.1 hypothetical protein UN65_01055 [Flavobacterium columnare]AUX17065.1 hypothetical protein AQ623_01105 [Flavobacterium columnare]QOG56072.1 hypothetical protein HUE29_01075 [Flavobacterium columnare]QOG58794.1 hypothetical protein HUE30_01075 [Flavobacterium columnare]QOG61517.1 hypothetical protein HUE31_01080 [Flavobacterium columnare]